MQRIALIASAILALTGCATPTTRTDSARNDRRLPDPLMATRRPQPPPLRPPPPQPAPPVQPAPQEPQEPPPYAGGIPPLPVNEIMPRGGIRKDLWRTFVIHHSVGTNATPQGMDAYHRQRGWENGLGYHFVIGNGVNYPDGKVFVGPRWKQQMQGAHCKSGAGSYFGAWRPGGFFNDHGIGICLIGNFEESRPTPKQMAALEQLIEYLGRQTGIPPARIYGHGEVTHKTACPGRNLNITRIRQSVADVLAGSQ